MKVSKKIKMVRTTTGLNQEEFAKTIGASRANLSNIERGATNPSEMFLRCISATYDIDYDWLKDEKSDSMRALSDSEVLTSEILEKYQTLNEDFQALFDDYLDQLCRINSNYIKDDKVSDTETND